MKPSVQTPKGDGEPAPSLGAVWVVGFVGHRTGVDEAALSHVIESELALLWREVAAADGTLHFYSSVADGADLLALDVADRLGLPLHVVLPLPEEDFFRPFPSERAQARARARLASIRARPGRHTWRVAPTSMRLPDAYLEADLHLVEACDALLVVWDGRPEAGLGGTAQVVQFARARRCPIVWIHKDTGETVREHFAPDWARPDAKFVRFAARGIVLAGTFEKPGAAEAAANRYKEALAALARKNARWFRNAIGLVAGLSAGAAVTALLGGLLPHDTPEQRIAGIACGVLEFAFLIWVLRFKSDSRRKQMRDDWIDARFARELYRGLDTGQPLLDPLHPPVAFLRPEWRRFVLTLGLLLHAERAAGFSLADFRVAYAKDRLGDQEAQFRKQGATARRWAGGWGRLGDWCVSVWALCISVACINRVWEQNWHQNAWGQVPVSLLPVLLPIVAGLASSLTLLLDDERRAGRYPGLEKRLVALRAELPHHHTEGSLRRFVEATEAMLLDELLEWYSVTSRADPG